MFYVSIVFHNIFRLHGCVSILYLVYAWAFVILSWKETDVNTNSKNVVNSVSIFNDNVAMNSDFKEWKWDKQCFMCIVLGV